MKSELLTFLKKSQGSGHTGPAFSDAGSWLEPLPISAALKFATVPTLPRELYQLLLVTALLTSRGTRRCMNLLPLPQSLHPHSRFQPSSQQ